MLNVPPSGGTFSVLKAEPLINCNYDAGSLYGIHLKLPLGDRISLNEVPKGFIREIGDAQRYCGTDSRF